ncbi:MAG: hypothetical protein R3190_04330, partial [Thermoanaerobaculia bacterium]|nr:hypothetical protein [Thermoanaerobaculia bacterium]
FLYCTSKEFLLRFGLDGIKDLPPLDEIEDLLASQLEADVGDDGDAEEGGTLLLWQEPEGEISSEASPSAGRAEPAESGELER